MIAAVLLAASTVAFPRVYEPGDDTSGYDKVPPPGAEMKIDRASATSVPWVDSNGWRFLRGVKKAFYAELPERSAPLAAAEAYAYGVDALLQIAPADAPALDSMLVFLHKIDRPRMPLMVNVGLIDDGSEEFAEVLNLMSRRNLLYKVVAKPDPHLGINVRIDSKEFPKESIADPNEFAARIRAKITDEKRLVRIYNTYTVLVQMTGDRTHVRLHLLNYARRPAKDVRIRVLGSYDSVQLAEAQRPEDRAMDVAVEHGGTEFTIPQITTYAVVDLERRP